MTILADPPITPLAALLTELTECVCNELATTGAGPTCWCGQWPGLDLSWEFCTDCPGDRCGMGWVRLAGINPYQVFPTPIVDPRCALPLAVTIEVGALRCIPQPADGSILDPGPMGDVAVAVAADAYALRRAVLCCNSPDLALGFWQPVGPEGGCVGGFWTTFLATDG